MSEQNYGQAGVLITDHVVNQKPIICQQLPAVLICKMPEILRISSVTAVVVCNDSEATCRRDFCESLITLVMLSEAMKYLDNTEYITLGMPVGAANRVLVGRFNLKRPGLHAGHTDTT